MHREGDYLFAHAGIRPGVKLEKIQNLSNNLAAALNEFLEFTAWFAALPARPEPPPCPSDIPAPVETFCGRDDFIALVIASNYLVQLPITLLGFHSTWGAFSFPFIFLATDLTVRLIGKTAPRKDAVDKTNGRAQFTQDLHLPGMLVAVVAHPPRFGGKVKSFDASKAKAVKGVVDVRGQGLIIAFHCVPFGVEPAIERLWSSLRASLRAQGQELLVVSTTDLQDATLLYDDPRVFGPTSRTDARHSGTLAAVFLVKGFSIAPFYIFKSPLQIGRAHV